MPDRATPDDPTRFRSVRISIYVTPAEKAVIRAASQRAGIPVSDWARRQMAIAAQNQQRIRPR